MKIGTPLTRFKEAHPSAYKDPVEAIAHLTEIEPQKMYRNTLDCMIYRRGKFVDLIGHFDDQNAKCLYKKAQEDANTWGFASKDWGDVYSITYKFYEWKVTGTRGTNGTYWVVTYGQTDSPKEYTDDKELSSERAQIVLLHHLSKYRI